MNKRPKIVLLLLYSFLFVCCAGAGSGSASASKADTEAVRSSIEVIESLSPSSKFAAGEAVNIELSLKEGAEVDSVLLFIDGVRVAKDQSRYEYKSDKLSPLGRRTFRFDVYKDGGMESRMGAFTLLMSEPPQYYGYRVEKSYPHNDSYYTQGLLFRNGILYEGTGMYGESLLAKVELSSGKAIESITLADRYFGEGITLLDDKIYQITWREARGFVYDANSFELLGEFGYSGEGWGITNDGEYLYMSNGSNKIRVIDPADFSTLRTIEVTTNTESLSNLNELEWIDGEIWANVYMSDYIVKIDPVTGAVNGVIDFSGLLPDTFRTARSEVLNGVAYDELSERIFVTGKYWSRLFEVSIFRR